VIQTGFYLITDPVLSEKIMVTYPLYRWEPYRKSIENSVYLHMKKSISNTLENIATLKLSKIWTIGFFIGVFIGLIVLKNILGSV